MLESEKKMASPEVIEASKWDHPPVRQILVALLAGDAQVHGNLKDVLIAAEHAGLLELASVCVAKDRKAWHVKPTLLGSSLALRIGSSAELCEVLDCRAAVGAEDWAGISPGAVMAELDLRDGGTGHVSDWRQWGELRGREYLRSLPRRCDPIGRPS